MPSAAAHDSLHRLIALDQLGEGLAGNARRIRIDVQRRAIQSCGGEVGVERGVVFEILVLFALGDLVQRRLRNVDMAALDQFSHLTEEKGQQQRADMRAVDIRIGHDNDAVVAEFFWIELLGTDAASQRGHQGADFRRSEHLVEARLFDI